MHFAIELFPGEQADHQVRQVWAALDREGIRSLGGDPESMYRPHVSLSVFEQGDPAEVAQTLQPILSRSIGLPLPLVSLGFFPPAEAAPVFLGVAPSARFLKLHSEVNEAIDSIVDGICPCYRPDALLPHCTLAMRVAEKAKALEIAAGFELPIMARVGSAHLVEVPGGRIAARLDTEA
ncbi:2'-5' RNA ligase family protein [Glycomyces sp. NPDC049804]|uniref:2'-5' RNA ligase family protein n=1 Tax=Glycomyces sp. NPDC049804 TaxID=3154363 RepID=UPI003423980A